MDFLLGDKDASGVGVPFTVFLVIFTVSRISALKKKLKKSYRI